MENGAPPAGATRPPATGLLAGVLVLGIVVGLVGFYVVQRLYLTGGMDEEPLCEARVQILDVGGGKFEVRPKNVCLLLGRHLKWDVKTPKGDKVEIIFDDPLKPFKHTSPTIENPQPGVYKTEEPKEIDSNEALTVGRHAYKVLWTPAGGDQTVTIDPAVCIRDW